MTTKTKSSPVYGYITLAAVAAVGLGIGIVRLINGMGGTTNLSDAYPWGLWIVYDVFSIPFAAGAFMISLVAHIYNREEYHDIARPVVLAGFAGYTGVVAILLMDLGRWHQFYSVLLPWRWNLHSFMFEVSLCITMYTVVLVLEIAPIILERLNWQGPLRLINTASAVIAGAGIVLSSLHQSSLGSLFLLMPYKLHPLWWTPLLPLMFFTSAAFSGLAMAIFVAVISYRAFRRHLELGVMANLAKVVFLMQSVYLAFKVGDLIFDGELALIFSSQRLSVLFLVEMLIGVIAPMFLFGMRKTRESAAGLVTGATCVLVGMIINRSNVAFMALAAPSGAAYFPHWMEIVLSIAVVAVGVLLFSLAALFLPVLPAKDREGKIVTPPNWPLRSVALTGFVLLLLTVAVVLLLQPVARAATTQAAPAPASTLATFARSQSESCEACHLDQETLTHAGAEESELDRLTIEQRDPEVAHSNVGCVTCHWGVGDTEDVKAAHVGAIADPTRGDFEACLACHHDMPDIFPGDRLQTPHSDVVHGHEVDMHCSDCHEGVSHGLDLMSGELICPMDVCLDCHIELGLESEFEDCAVCHTGPHDLTMQIQCDVCHQSTKVWEETAFADHPVELIGAHATLECFDCHNRPEFEDLRYVCSDCHERTHDFGDDDCAKCHTPADEWGTCVATGKHPFPTDHGDTHCDCTKCHRGGDTSSYRCDICHDQRVLQPVHEAQGIHYTKAICVVCHPQGQKP
ncbi:MAG: Ni/Fe-hydrogenase cytochrome b subunit [Chloroflexi bacterium]|nr:MAG: Ni/Fe-hydrogenase cytochrome b subunit [Chloroflexota bacterium]